ncbi:ATP-binding protein, partial [Thermodesulfobacteriota bacterium]
LHSTDPLHESAREIVEAGKRSAELTKQLLAFSRRQALQPEVLDLSLIIINMEGMLRRIIGKDIELTTNLANDLDNTEVDPGQIEQVIVNMAINARDAMPQGGELAIETANVELDKQYTRTHLGAKPGDYVMLSMTDNGCGMDKETLEKVFEPFYTTKEKGKGTGLGLSTVYGIVKQSGGNIYAYSESGHGTSFKIYLPSTIVKLTGEKGGDHVSSIKGRGEKILVVEDEPSLRKYCEKTLKTLNYNVTVAANGEEALLLVEEENLHTDLILTDVVMPKMSGTVMIDRLKETMPDLKVLYMSGYTGDTIVHHGVLDKDTPFIQKPFTRNKLGKKIRSILDKQ